jgi:hypothetical protein
VFFKVVSSSRKRLIGVVSSSRKRLIGDICCRPGLRRA